MAEQPLVDPQASRWAIRDWAGSDVTSDILVPARLVKGMRAIEPALTPQVWFPAEVAHSP